MKKTAVVIGILLIACVLRAVYAFNLPLFVDESWVYDLSKQLSLTPKTFNLPMGKHSNHPMFAVYLMALGNWLGGGSVFVTRLVFVLLSMLGLVGLFLLANAFFGYRTAVLTILLAALDRHLFDWAARITEPSVLFLTPWLIWLFYRCVQSNRKRDWLLLGLAFGIGYNFYPLILFLLPPFAVYMLLFGRIRSLVLSGGIYLAAGAFAASVVPNALWNLEHSTPNLEYALERGVQSGFGITPRFFLLLFGDLLVCLKDSDWILMSMGHAIYHPRNLVCHWPAGVLYLAGLAYSCRFFRREKHALLLLVALGVAVQASVVFPLESWNNFWYASYALHPIILLTAFLGDRCASRRPGKIIVVSLLLYLGLSTLVFLSGPKWGYMSPDWEKAYIGKMDYYLVSELFAGDNYRNAHKLTGAALKAHPDNPIVHCFRGLLAQKNKQESLVFFEKALARDPYHPFATYQKAEILQKRGEVRAARRLLRELMAHKQDYYIVRWQLVLLEYKLGNYGEVEKQINRIMAMKPDSYDLYKYLALSRYLRGKTDAAEEALEVYANRCFHEPAAGYLEMAVEFAGTGLFERAERYAQRAGRVLARYAAGRKIPDREVMDAYKNLGIAYLAGGRLDQAFEIFKRFLDIDPDSAEGHVNVAFACFLKQEYLPAIEYYDRALELGAPGNRTFAEALEPYRK